MLAYQNDPAVKAKFQARFAAHRAADEVIQGEGFNAQGRGCFIGCTMNAYSHEAFANQIGPLWLAHLADKIFEGIPKAEAPQFGTDLLEAIRPGADLEPVRFMIAISRHERQLARLEGNAEPYADECRKALQGVIDYCKLQLAGTAAESARSAAWSAARSAESAARSAARSAWSAARSAWSAARSAESARSAWSAAESAAESAWSDEFQIERDTLFAAIRSLP
jgi:hypothetical protein